MLFSSFLFQCRLFEVVEHIGDTAIVINVVRNYSNFFLNIVVVVVPFVFNDFFVRFSFVYDYKCSSRVFMFVNVVICANILTTSFTNRPIA